MFKPLHLDVVIAADPRRDGGGAEALAAIVPWLAAQDRRVTLLPVLSPLVQLAPRVDPRIADLVDDGRLTWFCTSRPAVARLGIGLHLSPFLGEADKAVRLRSDRAVLLVDQSWHTARHHAVCPFHVICDRASRMLGALPALVPLARDIHLPSASDETVVPCTPDDRGPVWAAALQHLLRQVPPPERKPILNRGSLVAPARILMLSPNGIGMGHLTRQLAIARHLPPEVEPVFIGMSRAVGLVERFGFRAEYAPGPHALGVDKDRWTDDFSRRLIDAMGFYDARALVFDGNFPYHALRRLRAEVDNRTMIWLRRGLWRPNAGREALERSPIFDLVIEPTDFAGEMDAGPTRARSDAVPVPPIILLDPSEHLSRDEARRALGLPKEATAVLVQLGSGNNFDMATVARHCLDMLAGYSDVHVRVVQWLIAEDEDDLCAAYDHRMRRLRGYPLARFLDAFDFAVSAAGYNSFHELLTARLPTIFVPNEHPLMDEQETRALFAERLGAGFFVRAGDPGRLHWALTKLLDRGERDLARRRAGSLSEPSGAARAASMIALHALSIVAHRGAARFPRHLARW
ncbi:MAG: hypothetical protein KDE35_05245 [Geminicoccaceae bacterium]|nr:hypothetical protein [Geminicoccaceae bacterium]